MDRVEAMLDYDVEHVFQIWNIFFSGRYIILLMGLFSIYTGLIYNDVFSKSINLFGSSWSVPSNDSQYLRETEITLNPDSDDFSQQPYPLGLDPVWQVRFSKMFCKLYVV